MFEDMKSELKKSYERILFIRKNFLTFDDLSNFLDTPAKMLERIRIFHIEKTNIDDRMQEPKFPNFYSVDGKVMLRKKDFYIFQNYVFWLYNYMETHEYIRQYIQTGHWNIKKIQGKKRVFNEKRKNNKKTR